MELSTIEEDLLALDRFFYRIYRTWEGGLLDNVIIWYRVRKLLDYD